MAFYKGESLERWAESRRKCQENAFEQISREKAEKFWKNISLEYRKVEQK